MRNKKELKKRVNKLIKIAKSVYPKVKYNVLIPGFEGEDATIEFFSPRKYEDKLDKALVPVAVDILLEDRYFIGTLTLSDKNIS
jgi:hypothetical protein